MKFILFTIFLIYTSPSFSSNEVILIEKDIPVFYDKTSPKPDNNLFCHIKVSWFRSPDSNSKNNILIELEAEANEYFDRYSRNPIYPVISDFDFFLNTSSGQVSLERPVYFYKYYDFNNQNQVTEWKPLDCPKISARKQVLSSIFFAGLNFVPILGTIISATENITNTIKLFTADKINYLKQWNAAYKKDQYSVSRPLKCKDELGGKAYQIWIPLTTDLEDMDLELAIQRITVLAEDNYYAKANTFKLAEHHTAYSDFKVPLRDLNNYSFESELIINGATSSFSPEINMEQNNLVLEFNYSGNDQNLNYYDFQPSLIFDRGALEITSLPTYYNNYEQSVTYSNVKKDEIIKLAFNWALFAGGLNYKGISGYSNVSSSFAKVSKDMVSVTSDMSAIDLIEKAWEFENNFDRFILPIPDQRSGIIKKIVIPVNFMELSEFYLELKGNIHRIGTSSNNRITGSISTFENINSLFLFTPASKKKDIKIIHPKRNSVWKTNIPQTVSWEAPEYSKEKPLKINLKDSQNKMIQSFIGKNTGSFTIPRLSSIISSGYYTIEIDPFLDNQVYTLSASELFNIVAITSNSQSSNSIIPIRTTFAHRNVNYIREINVNSEYITISAYDHAQIDGDIISLYLNGENIINNYELKSYRKKINVKLDKNIRNDLFLFAHNTGTLWPNTVAIEISDGFNTQNFILNSNLNSCEAVVIHVK